ncbi:MAG: chloride channel protein [Gammaproteobacteria bacterium]|nr:chloride channel protein [Gammaproteobacteria bacterium]
MSGPAKPDRPDPVLKSIRQRFADGLTQFVETQRLRTAHAEAIPQLALAGIVCGIASGAVIILFRLVVENVQAGFLPAGVDEAYEDLSMTYRFVIPLVGGVAIGVLLQLLPIEDRQVGVVHVMERLEYHQGYLPFKNALVQFIGAGLSIISGHSVGREGPSIHLGAAAGSLFARRLGLPNNSIRTLVGCGVAAAIAAGFNTPLAGVILAMEVVLMEYTIVGFTPIILAAVSATMLSRAVYGEAPAFSVPAFDWTSIAELPYVLLMGLAIGVLAALFIALLLRFSRMRPDYPIWLRTTLAGLLVGVLALPAPAIMGVGYDTVTSALVGDFALSALLLIVVAKLLATTIGLGLGLPGGLIGPTLVIGATAGGAAGMLAELLGADTSYHGFYAMLGMGAMMGATLQAPLAALIALLELTANPKVILPGMVAVVSAALVARVVFGKTSVFRMIMQTRGLDYRNDPVSQALRRVGVASVMDRDIARLPRQITRPMALELLKDEPRWVLVREESDTVALLPATDLARYLNDNDTETIDLLAIPARRRDLSATTILATLQETHEILTRSGTEAVYVTGAHGEARNKIYGVLTRDDLEKSYRL